MSLSEMRNLAREMHADSRLVLLLLDAPSCGTTNALARAVPGLRAHGLRICVPQADPSHYRARPAVNGSAHHTPSNAAIDELALRVFKGRLDATGAAVGLGWLG